MSRQPRPIRTRLSLLLAAAALALSPYANAQQDQHPHGHGHEMPSVAPRSTPADTRQVVAFPPELKRHELANMRDHLATLSAIQDHLARYDFDGAGELAEKRLGMSSFGLHGAHEVAPFMPKGMREMGTAMHRAASQFGIATQEAAIDRDLGRALTALNKITRSCVACHAAYRLE
ncbi:MAG: hypothetical protein OEW21_15815 [Betaproteobacteria bacterium]|nr:hypothetical protein [Betaproteobacteria bacterium]